VFVAGDSHERFFFKTLTSITYGEGFVGENGKGKKKKKKNLFVLQFCIFRFEF
jgi:hypothetical protein